MSSYVLARSTVQDAEAYRRYRELAGPSVRAHGGSLVVKGGVVESLEGEEVHDRIALLQFPTSEAARAWFDSAAYGEARVARQGAGAMELTLFEG